jgi:hypothetical protein
MADDIKFVEATALPICPYCNAELAHMEYRRQKLALGMMSGFVWVIVLSCPSCHRVLGTQSDG